MPPAALKWTSATLTHVGNVRKLNEDSCLDRADIGLWVVADGMGGHSAGDLASQLVVSTLSKLTPTESLSRFIDAVEDGILYANTRLVELAAETNQTSGSTVVALLAHHRHGIVLWAGDSRAYRLRGGRLEQLSTDHSQVEYYVQKGLLTREQALHHPTANMVTRAVGASEDLFLDLEIVELAPGDRFLLCSDGLDKHVPDADIAKLLGAGDIAAVAKSLIDATLARGAIDNVTVSVIEIHAADAALQRGAASAVPGAKQRAATAGSR